MRLPEMLLVSAVVLLFLAVFYFFYARRTLSRIEDMLRRAEAGAFSDRCFSESRLSRLESAFADFLSQKQLERKRHEGERRSMEQLIGDIAHQVNTPLSNILVYAQLLCEDCEEGSGQLRLARRIVLQDEKLTFLVDTLLKASRLENGMVRVECRAADLAACARDAAESLGSAAGKKHIVLKAAETERPVTAFFDYKWTLEALENVIGNAVKFTPENGHVTIQVKSFELFACVAVEDDGPGIREEEQAQIFKRFYRGKDAAGTAGSGIGLFLTREILEKQGGYVKVKSEPGQGSCFQIYLPVCKAAFSSAQPAMP